MVKTRIAIFLGIAAYAAFIVAPYQAKLDRLCGDLNEGSPAYARCQLAVDAGTVS